MADFGDDEVNYLLLIDLLDYPVFTVPQHGVCRSWAGV